MEDNIPEGYVSTESFADLFKQLGLTYRNITFYRQSGIFPQPIRVKGFKEKYWNLDFMTKRLQTIYFLGQCLDFSIDEIRFFIINNEYPEVMIEVILESFDKLNRHNIFKIGDMVFRIWALSLNEGFRRKSFSAVRMADLTAILLFWHIKGVSLEEQVLLYKMTMETYKIINENVSCSDNSGIAVINEKIKEIGISLSPPRTIKLKGFYNDKKNKEWLLKVTSNKKITVV
ncbi:MAG: hypothetical protein L6308_02795 [Candidatus Omnitrophica bacterium]|nr:hypothetical protein [Candidatus Omnitrophota bacterium]